MAAQRTSGAVVAGYGAILAGSLLLGRALASSIGPVIHSGKASWILGRGLGLASLLSLAALVSFGVMIRHPLRAKIMPIKPLTVTKVHSTLGAATFMLVIAHLTAMALDPWAHIGWLGALVPGASTYRTVPVALGTVALLLMLVVGGTARMAGRLGRVRWLQIHRVSWLVLLTAVIHGLTTGSDTTSLRFVYAGVAGIVVALALSARLLRALAPPRQGAPGGAR